MSPGSSVTVARFINLRSIGHQDFCETLEIICKISCIYLHIWLKSLHSDYICEGYHSKKVKIAKHHFIIQMIITLNLSIYSHFLVKFSCQTVFSIWIILVQYSKLLKNQKQNLLFKNGYLPLKCCSDIFSLTVGALTPVLKTIVLFSRIPSVGSFSKMFSMQLTLFFTLLGISQNVAAAHLSNVMILWRLCFPLSTFFLSVEFLEYHLLLIWLFFKRFSQTSFLFIVSCFFSFCFSMYVHFIFSLL